MEKSTLPELLIQELRKDKIKVFIRTHPSVKYQHNTEKELDGNLTIRDMLIQLNLKQKLKIDDNQNILCFLQSCFLANPLDKIQDLQQSVGTTNSKGQKELIMSIALENAWG